MQIPNRFDLPNQDVVFGVIREHPLATLITSGEQETYVSHLPLVLQSDSGQLRLIGHMSRRNLHWQAMQKTALTKVIFHGPNAYITPTWYEKNDVPTWNYAVVHIDGGAKLIEDHGGIVSCLKVLSESTEPESPDAWRFWIPDDLAEPNALVSAIVGFEISVTGINAKLKLSQNRSVADREGVMKGLSERTDDMSREVFSLMQSSLKR